jgi:signal transduction histidine kinase
MDSKPSNLFFSFRTQIVTFTTVILLGTIASLYILSSHLEHRITRLVDEHLREVSLAVDLAQSSFPSGDYLYNIVPQDGRLRVGLDESHIIHRILVVDAEGVVYDSVEPSDIGKTLDTVIGDLFPLKATGTKRVTSTSGREPERVLTYPVETEKGKRRIVIIVSPHLLGEIVREEARERLIAVGLLSLLLVAIVALASWRFTHPIKELSDAALKVSSGNLNFEVPIFRRDEVGQLARTFNEMLAGLRDKRALEERLRRAERTAISSRVAAGIAHEIRNPLSFISLSVDYAGDRFAPAAEEARADFTRLMDSIKQEINRLNGLVSDFLNLGRPPRLRLRELDARSLVEEVVGLVRAKAQQQGVNLTVRVTPQPSKESNSLDTHIRADADQLMTCFSNLAINAVQAMPEGGKLAITLHPRLSNVEVRFADTGHGIAPESLEHLFEPYFTTKERGTGLGLALTKKLIEDHGGRITVESRVGMGTTFTITLAREPEPDPQSDLSPQPALGMA